MVFLLKLIFFFFIAIGCNQKKTKVVNKGIISTAPSLTEYIIDLNLENDLVGVTPFCKVSNENIERIGTGLNLNVEKILKLSPRFVLLTPWTKLKEKKILKHSKLEIIELNQERLKDVYETYNLLALNFNLEKLAQKKIKKIKRKITELKLNKKSAKVILFIDAQFKYDKFQEAMVAGKKTFYDDLFLELGLKNLIKLERNFYKINREKFINMNPDLIIHLNNDKNQTGKFEKLWAREKNKLSMNYEVMVFDNDYLFIPGPRIDFLAKDLVKALKKIK